jgi:branched-chain amino acid transport system substrate-binding protein
MFGKLFSRRGATLAAMAAVLAGCQVIPKTEPIAPPPPAPEPSDTVLPDDQGRHRIALLVPLSGENGAAGQAIANAGTMAILDTNAANLRITTYDTAGDAGAAAQRALADGNELILGPLLPEEVTAVLARARPAKVPVITFANDASVAAADVFVMGSVPEQSISRTVRHAVSQGARNFAALLPDGDYGNRAGAALEQAVTAAGGRLVATDRYDRSNTSVISAAQRLRRGGGYDAVLIADGARISALAAKELRPANAALPTLIGTELWSGDAEIARNAVFRGALFSAVSDNRFRQFSDAYRGRFGETPHRIATLGYDAVLLTLRLTRDWREGRPFPVRQMYDSGGFLGIDGAFRFGENSVVERALEVRQASGGSVVVVSAVPEQFRN